MFVEKKVVADPADHTKPKWLIYAHGLMYGIPAGLVCAAILSALVQLPEQFFLLLACVCVVVIVLLYVRLQLRTAAVAAPRATSATPMGDVGFTPRQLLLVVLFCMVFPIVGGAVLYHIFRWTSPRKARQANDIAWIVFAVYLFAIAALFIFGRGQGF